MTKIILNKIIFIKISIRNDFIQQRSLYNGTNHHLSNKSDFSEFSPLRYLNSCTMFSHFLGCQRLSHSKQDRTYRKNLGKLMRPKNFERYINVSQTSKRFLEVTEYNAELFSLS